MTSEQNKNQTLVSIQTESNTQSTQSGDAANMSEFTSLTKGILNTLKSSMKLDTVTLKEKIKEIGAQQRQKNEELQQQVESVSQQEIFDSIQKNVTEIIESTLGKITERMDSLSKTLEEVKAQVTEEKEIEGEVTEEVIEDR